MERVTLNNSENYLCVYIFACIEQSLAVFEGRPPIFHAGTVHFSNRSFIHNTFSIDFIWDWFEIYCNKLLCISIHMLPIFLCIYFLFGLEWKM